MKQQKPKKQKNEKKEREKKREKKQKKFALPTQPIFPNDFSHVVYLIPYRNILSTNHVCY